jgi:hypothetical protein
LHVTEDYIAVEYLEKTIRSTGIRFRPATLESPEHIGRTGRRGDLLKWMMIKVISETKAIGDEAVDMILAECVNAINEMYRNGGFVPIQWVPSKFPRIPATQGNGQDARDTWHTQAHVDGPTAFWFASATLLHC